MSENFRSGFVSIIGRPNAGKSTLLNALVGQKLAIVADKPQTTRTSIQGVLTLSGAQIVFLDTPGIHHADSHLNKRMMDAVRAALEERDLLLFVVDSTRPFHEDDRRAVDLFRKTGHAGDAGVWPRSICSRIRPIFCRSSSGIRTFTSSSITCPSPP